MTQADEMLLFLDVCDPNYYSGKTRKSTLSYTLEQNNLTFAGALLQEMSGKYEQTREYFLRDLKDLGKQLI